MSKADPTPTPAPAQDPEVLPPENITTTIVEYSETAAAIGTLRQRLGAIVYDFSKPGEMPRALKDRAEVRTYRLNLEEKREKLKRPLLEEEKKVDGEARKIRLALESLEDPIDSQIKNEEQRKERERVEREEAERRRLAEVQARITEIASMATSAAGLPSVEIRKALEDARALDLAFAAPDFTESAKMTRTRAVTTLEQLLAGAEALERRQAEEASQREREQKELAELREREKARQVEEDRANREKQARIVEEARARAAQEEQEKARRDAEEKAHREKLEAEERAARALRAEEDRIAHEARQAEAAKTRAEETAARERIETQEREARERARKEQEERDRQEAAARAIREAEEKRLTEERAKLETAQREIARREAELLDGTSMLRTFMEKYGEREEFTTIAKAIKTFLAKPK